MVVEEIQKAGAGIMVVITVAVLVIVAIFMFTSLAEVTPITPITSNETFTVESTKELEQVPITNTVQVYNQTYLDFDGVDDYIQAVNNPTVYFNKDSAYTYVTRLNPLTASGRSVVYSKGTTGSKGIYFGYHGGAGNSIIIGNAKDFSDTYFPGIPSNQWSNVACIFNGESNSTKCYYDGVEKSNSTTLNYGTLVNDQTSNLRLGRVHNSYFLNGSLSYFFGINGNLSSLEIKNIQQNENLKSNYSISSSSIGLNTPGGYSLVNDSLIYGMNGTFIAKSIDGGISWNNLVNTNTAGCLSTRILWTSSNGITIKGCSGTGNISISELNDDSSWDINKDVFVCKNQTGEGYGDAWFITEDNENNIYMGEYSGYGSTQGNCSYIHKSSDNGVTWNVVYNSTENSEFLGWHIHDVKYCSSNGYLYATQDGPAGNGQKDGVIRSTDKGETWEIIANSTNTPLFIGIGCGDGYRVFVSDVNNTIYKTEDDITFNKVYTLPSDYAGSFWQLSKDENTGLFVTSVVSNSKNKTALLISDDTGEKWFTLSGYETDSITAYKGITFISEIISSGKFIIQYDQQGRSYNSSLLNISDLLVNNFDSFVSYNLNENNGTIAYDSSGNGNDGTITGATWNNDGILLTLTNGIDYSISISNFVIENSQYAWSQIKISYTYADDGVTNAAEDMILIFGTYPLLIGLLGTIIFLGLIIAILFSSFTNTAKP